MWLDTAVSTLTESNIVYTDGHTDKRVDGHMDRQADSSIPPKNIHFAAV